MPALWRNCFLPAQATIYFTESSLTGAERLSPSQRNSPQSDSSMRAVTTAPAEHTPTYSQCHFFLVQETSASPCVHNICSPKSGNSWQLAGKGVTTIRLAAGKGLRPTRSSLAEREMQTGCLELRGEQSFIFEAIRIAGDPTDGRQCDTTHGQGPVEPAGNSLAPGARARPGGERGAGGHAAPGAGAAGPLLRLLSARPRPGSGTSQSRHPPCGVRPCYRPLWGAPTLRPLPPSAAAPPAPGPGPAPSAADGTRRPPELTSGGRYGGLLAFPPRLRPFFFFVFEPPPPPGAAPPRPRSAAPAPPPAGRQQPPNSSDTRESMADTAAPPPRCSVRSVPRPAPPARLRRHRPPRGAPGKRVPPAYNAENAPRAARSKLHLPACSAARPARSCTGSIRGG